MSGSKIKLVFVFCILLSLNSFGDNIISCNAENKLQNNFIANTKGKRFTSKTFGNANNQSSSYYKSGKHSVILTRSNPYGMTYILNNVFSKEKFRVTTWRHSSNKSGTLVVSCADVNNLYLTQSKSILSVGDWEQLTFDFIIPESANQKEVKIYTYCSSDSVPVYFDDLSIEYLCKEVINPLIETNFFIDKRDGEKYLTVRIGDDWWMAENLRHNFQDSSLCYESDEKLCQHFGKLYSFEDANNVSPEGWRLPNDDDWKKLERNIGMSDFEIESYGDRGEFESIKLREFGVSGFNVKLSGAYAGGFYNLMKGAYFWTSTEIDVNNAFSREISHKVEVGRFKDLKTMHFSVRCIKMK